MSRHWKYAGIAVVVAALGSPALISAERPAPTPDDRLQQSEPARPRSSARPPESPPSAEPRREPEGRTPDRERTSPQPEEPKAVPRADAVPPRDDSQAQRRQAPPRRDPPRRVEAPSRYRVYPRAYYFPPIDVRLGFYYHPYFGFYYGPYYGPYYPYPGPFDRHERYSASAVRTRVKPVETEVYVNGYYAGLVDDFDGVFQRLYVPAGQHVITLRLAGYRTFEQKLYLAPGDTFELNHQMLRLRSGERDVLPPAPQAVPGDWAEPEREAGDQPASPFGILAVTTEPPDARIYVDGEAWAGPSGSREFVLHLPAGWHELEVRKDGYQPFATKLELQEGETTRLDVTLMP